MGRLPDAERVPYVGRQLLAQRENASGAGTPRARSPREECSGAFGSGVPVARRSRWRASRAPGARRFARSPRPRSLRTRLVVAAVTLIAVVCTVIGTVTTIALRSHLYEQLDGSVRDLGMRASGPPHRADERAGPVPGGLPDARGGTRSDDVLGFVSIGPQELGTVGAMVDGSGTVVRAVVSTEQEGASRPSGQALSAAQRTALAATARDGKPHTIDLPGLGEHRVSYVQGERGSFLVGLPTEHVTNTLHTLIAVEVSVTAAGLVAASLAGAAMVGVALRPLRRVAATATRVSELPLHRGEVTLYERVQDAEADPGTEVGQVGAALNRMLDHVHGALDARQRSEMRVRQFVADASHELRTPLASIRGYAELTRRGHEETGPDTRHALGRIESEAHRMSGLVEDLLLLARLDAGRPLSYESTDLSPIVIDALSDARAAGPAHTWRLELPDEPALVTGDAARLHQVLVNLLGNARTHTPPGTTVTARVRGAGPWIRLDVEDDGPGVPPALLPHVFERFARGTRRGRVPGPRGTAAARDLPVPPDSVLRSCRRWRWRTGEMCGWRARRGTPCSRCGCPRRQSWTRHGRLRCRRLSGPGDVRAAARARARATRFTALAQAHHTTLTEGFARVVGMRIESSAGAGGLPCGGVLPAREHLPAGEPEDGPGVSFAPVLDVVIPVYNEEQDLESCVRRLHDHLARTFPYRFGITIADNASTDRTPQIAARLAATMAQVRSVRLEEKGRGRALRTVWSASEAPVLAYMDVDLSTDLNALLPLVAPLISGHSDLAIGSRLARSSRVVRGPRRELISRAYNLILRGSLAARFSDAQCGFKAIRREVARALLPLVEDTGWFFDTEMLVLAERAGLRIHEVPVDWVDDPDSTVHIVRTATDDLKGVWRVGRALAVGALPLDRLVRPFGDDPRDRALAGVPRGLARQLVGFCVVGVLSTLLYLLLYSGSRTFCGAQAANALALLLSAFANTAANRRLTFGVRGRERALRHQAQGLVVFAIGLVLTSGSLAALSAASADAPHSTELAVLIAANLAATVLRFLLMRIWVFAERRDPLPARPQSGPHTCTPPVSTSISTPTSTSIPDPDPRTAP